LGLQFELNTARQNDLDNAVDVLAARRFFARSATRTRYADSLAREVERRMVERLDYVRLAPERFLDAGCGIGHGVKQLADRYPDALPIAMDSAHALLAQARTGRSLFAQARALFSKRQPRLVCSDFSNLPFASRSFQLVWSNLALAWSRDPLEVFKEFRRVLDIGGLIMFSTYGPDTLKELRLAFAAADAWPHTLRFIDMHDLGDMLAAAGFSEPVMDMEIITLTYSDFDALAADLRLSGQANAARGRQRGLMGRGAFQAMRDAYECSRVQGRLPVTVEVVYGHAWRGESRVSLEGHSIIQTDFKQKRQM
jgi:malonyl-CoA O-methyltransferase